MNVGDDPETTASDETNCTLVLATGGKGTGSSGNLCQIDCSNRGICDHTSGICKCFDGYYGENCNSESELATYTHNGGS